MPDSAHMQTVIQSRDASVDADTGAVNKAYLLSPPGLGELVVRSQHQEVSCIIIDIAGMGIANEAFGREAVNRFMAAFVELARDTFDSQECPATVVRWGGDEFALLVGHGAHDHQKLIDTIDLLKQRASQLVDEHVGSHPNKELADIRSALKNHQRGLTNAYLHYTPQDAISLTGLREYDADPGRHEQVALSNLLSIYTGSWQALGPSPDGKGIEEAIATSDICLNAAKLGATTANHFPPVQTKCQELVHEQFALPTQGHYLDTALSDLDRQQRVLRLSAIIEDSSSLYLTDTQRTCLLVNVSHFGSYNNHVGPEDADDMLKEVAAAMLGAYQRESEVTIMRSAGGELMLFSDEALSEAQCATLGRQIHKILQGVLKEGGPRSEAAKIDAATKNEVKRFIASARSGYEGLGEVFLSQVPVAPASGSMREFTGDIKSMAHGPQSPMKAVFPADPHETNPQLIFDLPPSYS